MITIRFVKMSCDSQAGRVKCVGSSLFLKSQQLDGDLQSEKCSVGHEDV